MHLFEPADEALAERVLGYVEDRLRGPVSLNSPKSEQELSRLTGETVTEAGLGAEEAFRIFDEILAPACINVSHPRFLSFIPNAPTTASILFDMALTASAISADWWIEGSGAIHAENEALRWIARALAWPDEAGGVFVSGGTAGNLSALAVGRDVWRRRSGNPGRPALAIAAGGHSSLRLAARVLDVEVVEVAADDRGRMLGPALREALDAGEHEVFAVAATAGSTNFGAVDDLDAIARTCEERDIWMHVDGAYGGAGILAPSARPLFAGIERADSFVVDPHKWLFAPIDCAALLYRNPDLAAAAFTQKAEYIEVIEDRSEWNPSDFAVHLTRRARGLPLWFSLAAHGWGPYVEAIEHCIRLARQAAAMIEAAPQLELVCDPELSVVVFRRLGWGPADYQRWSEKALADGLTMTAPTSWLGETLLRFCFITPTTTAEDVGAILASLG
jgi:L-2,4-diaminobutyrate decarboxylase